MKKLTRKLFISILSMAFAVIAIGTTTFAWIAVSSTASIDPFTANVEAGDSGIELSLDGGTTWTNSINIASEIAQGFAFSDVYTADGATFKEMSFNGNTAELGLDGSADGKYISVTFRIRRSDHTKPAPETGSDVLNVYVDSSKVSFTSTKNESFLVDVPFSVGTTSYEANDIVDFITVANAARMSLVVGGATKVVYEAPEDHEKGTEEGAKGNTTGYKYDGFAAKYWEAKLGAPMNLSAIAKPTYDTKIAGASELSGVVVQLPLGATASEGVEITLNVWVEGFDNECHANILRQTLTVALGFTSAPATGE